MSEPTHVIIYGWPKSGTTALYFRILNAYPPGRAHGVFEPKGPYQPDGVSDVDLVLVKALWHGVTADDFTSYLGFDTKIWLARDPRDFLISNFLYHWHGIRRRQPETVQLAIQRIEEKERDPGATPFHELVEDPRLDFGSGQPAHLKSRIRQTLAFLERVRGEVTIYLYEDMIDGHYEPISMLPGVRIAPGAEVPAEKLRVVRSKGYGSWRDWFTPEDVRHYRLLFEEYLDRLGYADDWELSPSPTIDPEISSRYVRRLVYGGLPEQR